MLPLTAANLWSLCVHLLLHLQMIYYSSIRLLFVSHEVIPTLLAEATAGAECHFTVASPFPCSEQLLVLSFLRH
jgi:hypothetical protein